MKNPPMLIRAAREKLPEFALMV
jgi:hypothetical protein